MTQIKEKKCSNGNLMLRCKPYLIVPKVKEKYIFSLTEKRLSFEKQQQTFLSSFLYSPGFFCRGSHCVNVLNPPGQARPHSLPRYTTISFSLLTSCVLYRFSRHCQFCTLLSSMIPFPTSFFYILLYYIYIP